MLYTIGHSNRTQAVFTELLRTHGVREVVDVRTVPRSRAHPHFARERMEGWLPAAGVAYRHVAALGGLRRPLPDSRNGGWTHPAFRGYADHALGAAFADALSDLLALAAEAQAAIMCAEAVWWRCHRRIIADWALAAGAGVLHILGPGPAKPASLTPFARVRAGRVTYPAILR